SRTDRRRPSSCSPARGSPRTASRPLPSARAISSPSPSARRSSLPGSKRSSPTDATLRAVILAGGVGSRFWPVSTPTRPKQLLPLAGTQPLIAQTVERILPLVPVERIRVLTGRTLAGPIAEATGLGPDQMLIEPRARGTAPVLAWAAHVIAAEDPAAVMLSLHSDHVIRPADA